MILAIFLFIGKAALYSGLLFAGLYLLHFIALNIHKVPGFEPYEYKGFKEYNYKPSELWEPPAHWKAWKETGTYKQQEGTNE